MKLKVKITHEGMCDKDELLRELMRGGMSEENARDFVIRYTKKEVAATMRLQGNDVFNSYETRIEITEIEDEVLDE